MLIDVTYDREAAISYAAKWAFQRNPKYYDFHGIGGDCTNFVSQCIYAGAKVMNFTPTFGWYYISPDDRTPVSYTHLDVYKRQVLASAILGTLGVISNSAP